MPELPEVETLRRGLSAILPGRRIVSVRVLDHKVATGSPEMTGPDVTGHRIGRVGRRGKVLILWLDGSGSLLVHPKMTGQLILTVTGAKVVSRHDRAQARTMRPARSGTMPPAGIPPEQRYGIETARMSSRLAASLLPAGGFFSARGP